MLTSGTVRLLLKNFFKIFCFAYVSVVIFSLTNYKSRVIFTYPDFMFDVPVVSNGQKKCMLKYSDLSSDVGVNVSVGMKMRDAELSNPHVQIGGRWEPEDCDPWQRVAIIVPYRDRAWHLVLFLNRIHQMLQRQKMAYQVFVSEQEGTEPFNKGRLVNIAFLEALKTQHFDCIVMHDVDLLPTTDKNIFYCDTQARHLSPAIDELRFHPPYYNSYGGAIALNIENYIKINGFPNRYAGWGSEDDDVGARTIGADLLLTRPPYHIGKYKMIRHVKSERVGSAYTNFLQWEYWWKKDGLSSMNTTGYRVLSVTHHRLYTNITSYVGLVPDPPREDVPQIGWISFLGFFLP